MMLGPSSGVRRIDFANDQIVGVADGNSLMAGFGITTVNNTIPPQLAALPPINGSFVFTNVAVSGQTIADMRQRRQQYVDPLFQAGKINILMALEATNNIAKLNRTGAQSADDMAAYIAECHAQHPWSIVLFTAPPRFDKDAGPLATWNAEMNAYNAIIKANYRAMGAVVVCDVRSTGLFEADPLADSIPASLLPYMYDPVHWNDAGDAIVAGIASGAFRRIPRPRV